LYDEMEFLVRFLKEENHIIAATAQPSQFYHRHDTGRPHLRTEKSCWTKAPMFWISCSS
jgi:hypothetical protein